MADAETLIECVICFDSIAQAEPLPCRCTVPYCMKCWDRSLAQSFNACGQARCPTCRSPVRVDFDAEANDGRGRLVFSKEPADHSYEQEESELADGGGASPAAAAAAAEAPASIRRAEVVERLAEQAAPVMARLLGEWGAAHPSLRAMAREPAAILRSCPVKALKEALAALGGDATACVDKADLIAALEEAAGGRAPLAAYWTMAEATAAATAAAADGSGGGGGDAAAAAGAAAGGGSSDAAARPLPPRCVCGGDLVRMPGRERARRFLLSMQPGLEHAPPHMEPMVNAHVDALIAADAAAFICDVCERPIATRQPTWTCGTAERTILHASAYDVCEGCFCRHAVGVVDGYDVGQHD